MSGRWTLTDRRTRWVRRTMQRMVVVMAVLLVAVVVATAVATMPAWGWGALACTAVGMAATEAIKVKIVKDWTDTAGKKHAAGSEPFELPKETAQTLITCGYAEEVADEGTIKEELEKALGEFKAGIKAAVTDALKESVKGLELGGKALRISGGTDRREDDPMAGFKSANEFYKALFVACTPGGARDERLMIPTHAEGKVVGLTSGAEGGFLAPVAISNRIFERVVGAPNVISQCDRIVMDGYGGIRIPALADADRYTVATRHGGIVVYNVTEGGQITGSTPAWREIELMPHKKAALVAVTEEMMATVANFGERINRMMGDAIMDEVTEDIMFGTGVGVSQGAFTSAACWSVAKETDQDADTILPENIVKMEAALTEGSAGAQYWYNGECLPQLVLLVLTIGASGVPMFLQAGGLTQQPAATLWGRLATKTDHCEALGDAGDIVLGDFSQYLLLTQGSAQTDLSIHLYFDYAKTALRALFGCDGRPAWEKTLRPRKGAAATRVSPFIKLAARA